MKIIKDLIVNLIATWIAPYIIPYLDWPHLVMLVELIKNWLN